VRKKPSWLPEVARSNGSEWRLTFSAVLLRVVLLVTFASHHVTVKPQALLRHQPQRRLQILNDAYKGVRAHWIPIQRPHAARPCRRGDGGRHGNLNRRCHPRSLAVVVGRPVLRGPCLANWSGPLPLSFSVKIPAARSSLG
jgi:hypothetical protein